MSYNRDTWKVSLPDFCFEIHASYQYKCFNIIFSLLETSRFTLQACSHGEGGLCGLHGEDQP